MTLTLVKHEGKMKPFGRLLAMRMLLEKFEGPDCADALRSMGFDLPAGAKIEGVTVSLSNK